MSTMRRVIRNMQNVMDEARNPMPSWAEILRASTGNEGIAYVIKGTLDGIAQGKKPDKAFLDATENENFYGQRRDVVMARDRALLILKQKFGVTAQYVGEAAAARGDGVDEATKLPAGFDTPERRRALAKSVRKEVQAFIDSKVVHGAFQNMAEADPDLRKAYYKASDGMYALLNALDELIGTK